MLGKNKHQQLESIINDINCIRYSCSSAIWRADFSQSRFGYQGFACKILTPLICRSFARMLGLKPTRIQAFQGLFFLGEHILLWKGDLQDHLWPPHSWKLGRFINSGATWHQWHQWRGDVAGAHRRSEGHRGPPWSGRTVCRRLRAGTCKNMQNMVSKIMFVNT